MNYRTLTDGELLLALDQHEHCGIHAELYERYAALIDNGAVEVTEASNECGYAPATASVLLSQLCEEGISTPDQLEAALSKVVPLRDWAADVGPSVLRELAAALEKLNGIDPDPTDARDWADDVSPDVLRELADALETLL